MKRFIYSNLTIVILLIINITMLTACGKQPNKELYDKNILNSNALIGTWVSPSADNQILEIDEDKICFNYRKFDYTISEKEIHLYQTFPNSGGVSGNMPFELHNDTLVIDLGDDFEGYFYGRSGLVKLVRK